MEDLAFHRMDTPVSCHFRLGVHRETQSRSVHIGHLGSVNVPREVFRGVLVLPTNANLNPLCVGTDEVQYRALRLLERLQDYGMKRDAIIFRANLALAQD